MAKEWRRTFSNKHWPKSPTWTRQDCQSLHQQVPEAYPRKDSQTYLYRPTATHKIEVNAETALEHGICFFGNRFSDVVFAMGKWEGDSWDGKITVPDN